MKVKVKPEVCVGHGMCVLACPEVFRLSDEDGHSTVVIEKVPQELTEAVEQAVRSCPEGAIETDE